MLFNTYEFIFFFLPIAFVVYFYLNSRRLIVASKAWLVFSSLFFYSWWNIIYLPLILSSIVFNYAVSNSLIHYEKSKKSFSRKSIFLFGVSINVLLLSYFKYMDFFIENINFVAGSNIELLHIVLPLAISFFTLQQIAYLVDVYEDVVVEQDFLNYAVFVSFFPQLIAGPIVHHKDMMPQFANVKNKIINYKNILLGIFIFTIGLFKKVVIADTFSQWATPGFDSAEILSFFEAWATSLSYTFQLYFDFSGYADMAIGIALLFNIKLPPNFNSPYKSLGIIEFWQRWHITLSTFITAYIYTPLLKSFTNITFKNAMIATFLTMLIAGLWHGASWMFVIFGALHGSALIVNHLWSKYGFSLPKVLAWLITFNFVNIAWVFFRAKELEDAIKVLTSMFSLDNIVLPSTLESSLIILNNLNIHYGEVFGNIHAEYTIVIWIIVALLMVLLTKNSIEMIKYPKLLDKNNIGLLQLVFYATLLFVGLAMISLQEYSEFIYFNF